jgi:hypothetical protein
MTNISLFEINPYNQKHNSSITPENMIENALRYNKPEKQSTRSTVRFQGDFRAELQKTIDILELHFEEEL